MFAAFMTLASSTNPYRHSNPTTGNSHMLYEGIYAFENTLNPGEPYFSLPETSFERTSSRIFAAKLAKDQTSLYESCQHDSDTMAYRRLGIYSRGYSFQDMCKNIAKDRTSCRGTASENSDTPTREICYLIPGTKMHRRAIVPHNSLNADNSGIVNIQKLAGVQPQKALRELSVLIKECDVLPSANQYSDLQGGPLAKKQKVEPVNTIDRLKQRLPKKAVKEEGNESKTSNYLSINAPVHKRHLSGSVCESANKDYQVSATCQDSSISIPTNNDGLAERNSPKGKVDSSFKGSNPSIATVLTSECFAQFYQCDIDKLRGLIDNLLLSNKLNEQSNVELKNIIENYYIDGDFNFTGKKIGSIRMYKEPSAGNKCLSKLRWQILHLPEIFGLLWNRNFSSIEKSMNQLSSDTNLPASCFIYDVLILVSSTGKNCQLSQELILVFRRCFYICLKKERSNKVACITSYQQFCRLNEVLYFDNVLLDKHLRIFNFIIGPITFHPCARVLQCRVATFTRYITKNSGATGLLEIMDLVLRNAIVNAEQTVKIIASISASLQKYEALENTALFVCINSRGLCESLVKEDVIFESSIRKVYDIFSRLQRTLGSPVMYRFANTSCDTNHFISVSLLIRFLELYKTNIQAVAEIVENGY